MSRHFLLLTVAATGLAMRAASCTIRSINLSKALFTGSIPSLACACLVTGCASGFARFYDPAPNTHPSPVTQQASPLLKDSHNLNRDGEQLAREGFVLIGTSSFVTNSVDPQIYTQAMTHGMKVGAGVVLLHVDYTDVAGEDTCCIRVGAAYWAYAVDEAGGAGSGSTGATACQLDVLPRCANPFVLFYEPAQSGHGSPVTAQASPLFRWSRDPQDDGRQLMRRGYVLLGVSSFVTWEDGSSYRDRATTQGMKVGAAVVLLQVHSADVVWNHLRTVSVSASYWGEPHHPVER